MDNTSDKRRSRQTLARPVMADSRNDDAAIGIQTVSENGLEYDRKTFSYESEKGSAFRWADEHPGAAVNPPDGGIVSADAGYDDASADVHGMIEDIIKENERKAKSN